MIQGVDKRIEDNIIELAIRHDIKKVIVFGSRARGDHKSKSDIDLAVVERNIASFIVDIEEEVQTLLEFDIVDLGSNITKELRDSIIKEGKCVYEKI